MGEPLAQYFEVRPNGRRLFQLFAERVIVVAKSPRGDFVTTVLLADLRPETNLLRVRPKEYRLGVVTLAAAIAFGLALFLAVGLGLLAADRAIRFMSVPVGALVVSLAILLKTFRKIEFTQFVSKLGKPLLDVADAGPQRKGYRPFVEAIIEQMRASSPYMVLRGNALSAKRKELGIAVPLAECPIWGILTEFRIPGINRAATVLSLADGSASLYIDEGRSIIGGHSHESVRQAAAAFLEAANRSYPILKPAETPSLPRMGRVVFHARTDKGLLTADEGWAELVHGQHPLSALFIAGNNVNTELIKLAAVKMASPASPVATSENAEKLPDTVRVLIAGPAVPAASGLAGTDSTPKAGTMAETEPDEDQIDYWIARVGTGDHVYQKLEEIGEPAFHRLYQILNGKARGPQLVDWEMGATGREVALGRLGRMYPETLLDLVQGRTDLPLSLIWALEVTKDPRFVAIAKEARKNLR